MIKKLKICIQVNSTAKVLLERVMKMLNITNDNTFIIKDKDGFELDIDLVIKEEDSPFYIMYKTF